jgi:hypothetical protein
MDGGADGRFTAATSEVPGRLIPRSTLDVAAARTIAAMAMLIVTTRPEWRGMKRIFANDAGTGGNFAAFHTI